MINKNNLIEIFDDKIILNDIFNEPIEKIINILILKNKIVFGKNFNQSLINLPSNIEQILLGKNYNKSLNNLPLNVKSIMFANDNIFYGSIDYLHSNIEEIILGDYYNTIIK